MPLTDKYLKYSPEITLEIFTLVYNKLIDLKWAPNEMRSIRTMWKEFDVFPFLCDLGYSGMKLFGTFSASRYNDTETTVQEILGYDPFVKDDFVLPKKWHVRVTKENYNVLNNWRVNIIKYSRDNFDVAYEIILQDGSGGSAKAHKGETEITFDQFKKYVLKEAIETSKETNPEYVECLENHDTQFTKGKIYKVINSEFNSIEVDLDDNGKPNSWHKKFFKPSTKEAFDAQKEKQLKQAVHCTTQEEWDFVTEKLGYKWSEYSKWSVHKNNTCINLKRLGFGTAGVAYKGYQILSFQEWCDLNGYKMEKEVKFKVGKWYKCKNHNYAIKYLREKAYDFSHVIVYSDIIDDNKNYKSYSEGKTGVGYTDGIGWYELKDLSEIQQYLPDDHPDKIKPAIKQTKNIQNEFKVGDWVKWRDGHIDTIKKHCDRFKDSWYLNEVYASCSEKVLKHATPEEINNHLISIGQIPADEPLNTGIEPNKSNTYQAISIQRDANPQCTFNFIKINGQEILKPKMILSIDDEELPMINIIKTNTIKQLLSDD